MENGNVSLAGEDLSNEENQGTEIVVTFGGKMADATSGLQSENCLFSGNSSVCP